MQGNAVPARPIIEIQRSHISNFIKHARWSPTITHLFGDPKLTYTVASPLLSTLTSEYIVTLKSRFGVTECQYK